MHLLRYEELIHKEIINVKDGSRLGMLGQADLQIDRKTGKLKAIIIPTYSMFGLKKNAKPATIKWKNIQKIGKDIILVDFKA